MVFMFLVIFVCQIVKGQERVMSGDVALLYFIFCDFLPGQGIHLVSPAVCIKTKTAGSPNVQPDILPHLFTLHESWLLIQAQYLSLII